MAVQILEQYRLGDMTAVYLTDDSRRQVGMTIIPAVCLFLLLFLKIWKWTD